MSHEPFPGQAQRGFNANALRIGPLTAVLLGLSVAVAIWSKLGENNEVLGHLFITEYRVDGEGLPLPEIREGEVWRLLTPIFVHFSILHLLFNMMWLKDLGTAIEKLVGTSTLLGLTLVCAVPGNLGELAYSGPSFGGMSGVVYGLFGYVWMKAKFDPASGFRLDQQTVLWMVGWFVLCLTGAIGPVANVGHGVGLVVGMVWGFLSARRATGA